MEPFWVGALSFSDGSAVALSKNLSAHTELTLGGTDITPSPDVSPPFCQGRLWSGLAYAGGLICPTPYCGR